MDRFSCPPWALALFLLLTPLSASAGLMEIVWQGKWGDGRIVYDNGIADSEPLDDSWFFRNSIVSYDVEAWRYSDYEVFRGVGGSIGVTAFPPKGQCPATLDQPCRASSLVFYLGLPPSDGSPRYQVNFTPPLPIGRDGWPQEISGSLYMLGLDGGAYVSNDKNDLAYSTMDITHGFHIQPLQGAAVPVPATGMLVLLGLAGLRAASRRRPLPPTSGGPKPVP